MCAFLGQKHETHTGDTLRNYAKLTPKCVLANSIWTQIIAIPLTKYADIHDISLSFYSDKVKYTRCLFVYCVAYDHRIRGLLS